MNRYEKGPAATNYYHNNGYDERWDMEADTGMKEFLNFDIDICLRSRPVSPNVVCSFVRPSVAMLKIVTE